MQKMYFLCEMQCAKFWRNQILFCHQVWKVFLCKKYDWTVLIVFPVIFMSSTNSNKQKVFISMLYAKVFFLSYSSKSKIQTANIESWVIFIVFLVFYFKNTRELRHLHLCIYAHLRMFNLWCWLRFLLKNWKYWVMDK
jgi:hypothetical protein